MECAPRMSPAERLSILICINGCPNTRELNLQCSHVKHGLTAMLLDSKHLCGQAAATNPDFNLW